MKDEYILNLLSNQESYEKGFRLLMEKYQENIYWMIRRMVNNHEDANDIIQNTFLKVYKGLKNFKGSSKIYTWIYRIATNETISFLNKKKKSASISLDHDNHNLSISSSDVQQLNAEEIERRLSAAIEKLPAKQKLVFELRYFQEMSYNDISEAFNTSVGALKASYHIAAKKIETALLETL